jgi:hypothetical protein
MTSADDFPTQAVKVFKQVSEWADTKNLDLDTIPFSKVTKDFTEDPRNQPAYFEDKEFWKLALKFIGVLIIICLLGSIILAVLNLTIPDILITSASTAIGIFAGLFATNVAKK